MTNKRKMISLVLCLLLISCNHVTSNNSSYYISSSSSSLLDISSTNKTSSNSIIETKLDSYIQSYSIPNNVKKYEEAEVSLSDQEISLYNVKINTSQVWNAVAPNRADNGVAIFQLLGRTTVKVKCKYEIQKDLPVQLYPEAYNIIPDIDYEEKTITFIIDNPDNYVLEINRDQSKTLYFFVDEYKPIEEIPSNTIYFGPGLHNKNTNPLINSSNEIVLTNNQTVIIDYGAVIQGRFYANGQSNITIKGGGIIDGSIFDRNGNTGTRLIPLDFNYCNNIRLENISFLDPAGWTVNLYFNDGIIIDGIRIITSRSNGDGISLQSCQNAEVSNCFIRSWDDSLVVKNYPKQRCNNCTPTNQGTTKNIKFYNCTLWSDLAQAMEIGFETIGEVLENIVFENITVIKALHKPPLSIHNGNNAKIKNVLYKDITIENALMGGGDGKNVLIEFTTAFSTTWSTNWGITPLGSIENVEINNLKVNRGNSFLPIEIYGSLDTRSAYLNSIHMISNVSLIDVLIKKQVMQEDYYFLRTNEYSENITISSEKELISGASIIRTINEELIKQYNTIAIVKID